MYLGHLVEVVHALTQAPEAAQVGFAHYFDPPGHGAMLSVSVAAHHGAVLAAQEECRHFLRS